MFDSNLVQNDFFYQTGGRSINDNTIKGTSHFCVEKESGMESVTHQN
jgi:hypothetical protein